jgi:hypothetical protein
MSSPDNPFQTPQYVSSKSAYAPPSGQKPVSGMAVASLVLGILSLVTSLPGCCCMLIFLLSGTFGLIALVMGYFGLQECNQGQKSGKSLAIAGMVCGGIGLGFTLLLFTLIAMGVVADVAGQAVQQNQFNNNF